MTLMKSISYQNNNGIIFEKQNDRLDIHVKGKSVGSRDGFWHQTHKRWFVTLGSVNIKKKYSKKAIIK